MSASTNIIDYIGAGTATARPTPTPPTGGGSIYYANDTNVLYMWNGTAWETLYEKFVLSIPGTLTASTQYWTVLITAPLAIPASWSNPTSLGACTTPAASTATVLTVSYVRSGATTTIGTITFAVGVAAATLTGPSAVVDLLAGDILICTTGTTVDATLANVGFTMVGMRG